MSKPSDEDVFKELFANLELPSAPVKKDPDSLDDLFSGLVPAKMPDASAGPSPEADPLDDLFKGLDRPQTVPQLSQQAVPTPQAAGGSAIQQGQGAPVSPDFSQAFQTQTTPDGLVLGTFNSRFFSMPNYTLEQAKQIADKIKQSGANVIALQEIEGNAAMDNLMMPNFPGWQYKMNDTPDQQDLAFMWNPEAVTMNGEPLVYYADEVQPSDPNQKVFQRAPLVAEFIDKRTGTPFKMGNVHLKSQYVPQGVTKEEAALLKDRDDILRAYQISKLNELKDRLGKDGMPVFIPGDYNFNVAGTSSRNRAMRRGIDYKIKALENARGATDRHYSYDTGRYGQQLDVIGYHNVSPSELSPAFEVESKIPGVPHGPDHDIVASVWKAVNNDGLSPTDFAANPVKDPDVTAAKTTGHDPAFVNNPYVMDAIRGLESPVQRFDKHLTHARGQELNKSVNPWHYRIEMGRAGRSQHTPTLSQMMFAPASWVLDSLSPSERIEKPILPDKVKKGEGNAFTDFELRDVVPFISSVSSSIPKAIMKSFRPSDELLKGLGKSLKETGLGDFLAFRKWNKRDYDEEQLPTDYDWQPPTEQPMNIEDADNIKNWFVTPADQYEFQKREDPDKRTAEEKWKDFLASDPENSGFDAAPEYDLEGKSPFLKTADAPEGDKDFKPLLHVLNDVAYSTASGFNNWLGNLLNGAGVTAHAVTDPIGKWTGLWDPESTNFLQDAGRKVHSLKDRADREIIDKDALPAQVANQFGMMMPTLMMMAATGGASAPGTIASANAVSPLGAMARSTLGGSAAQTMSGTGYAYKTARELGGTHQQAMDVAGKAAIAETIMNTAANFLAGPHGLFTAGRLSNNEWLKRFFGAERWIERPFISPYRLFARATGFRWPRAYIGALKTSRASLDAGLRAYLQAYGRGEITRAAVQSTIPNRQIGGDPSTTFTGRLFSKESLPTGEKLKALIPAFYSGALSGLMTSLPQITKTFKEGYNQDAALYNRKRADKAQTIRMLEKQQKFLEGIPASERTPLHDQELRAVKYELNNSKSRSPLWETLFPYRSRLRNFHDAQLFGPKTSMNLNPVTIAKDLVGGQLDKFLGYWDIRPQLKEGTKMRKLFDALGIQPQFSEGSKEQAQLERNVQAWLTKKRNLSSEELDKFLNSYTALTKSARARIKDQYNDFDNARRMARVYMAMRRDRSERTEAREELAKIANVQQMLQGKQKSSENVRKQLQGIVDRESKPTSKSKAALDVVERIKQTPDDQLRDMLDYELMNLTKADLPRIQHENEVQDRAFDRIFAQLQNQQSAATPNEKAIARSREVLQNIAYVQDPLAYLYSELDNRSLVKPGPDWTVLLKRANELTPIERLIYGK